MSLLARQLCCRLASQVGQRSLATTPCLKAAKTEKDQMTHTGQQFSESDPRNVRFAVTGLEKQVNNQWAIDLIKEVPPIAVNKRVVGLVLQSVCLELTIITFRSPVTEVVELSATLESTSTWTMVNLSPASTAVLDISSTRRRDVVNEQ